MKFKFKAITTSGNVVEDVREAQDKVALLHNLKAEGLSLVTANEVKEGKGLSMEIALFQGVKTHERIMFARNLASMLDAGLAISRALAILEKQTKNKNFKRIINQITEEIKKGKSFSETLKMHPKVFPTLFISMVAAGEESGKLSESLNVIASQMEKTYLLQKKIKGALMYPGVIMFAMLVIGIFMLVYIVPSLTSTFKELNADLPASTKLIIFVSDSFKEHFLLVIGLIVSLVGAFFALSRTSQGKKVNDWLVLHIPVISPLVKETNAARTARTLASLLSSGVPVVNALHIVQEVMQNSYYKQVLAKAEKNIQVGAPISAVFSEAQKFYPIFVGEMIAVGEETGELGPMLMKVALFYEEEVEQKTKDMSTIIEPFLMLAVGLAVGFFAISMITPMYSLVQKI